MPTTIYYRVEGGPALPANMVFLQLASMTSYSGRIPNKTTSVASAVVVVVPVINPSAVPLQVLRVLNINIASSATTTDAESHIDVEDITTIRVN